MHVVNYSNLDFLLFFIWEISLVLHHFSADKSLFKQTNKQKQAH